jgi:hypothetical protein
LVKNFFRMNCGRPSRPGSGVFSRLVDAVVVIDVGPGGHVRAAQPRCAPADPALLDEIDDAQAAANRPRVILVHRASPVGRAKSTRSLR